MSDAEEYDEEELTLTNSDVVTKYKAAAEITNKALAFLISECKPGAHVVDLCIQGDDIIEKEIEKVFNKPTKEGMIEKGIAFPTCISINHCCGHFSPQPEDDVVITDGDVCKIDLGCHIDGWISVAAHTVVAQSDPSKPVGGKAAKAVAAARDVFQLALREIRPGKSTATASDRWDDVAKTYGCQVLDGTLTHSLKRFIVDGNKVVLNKSAEVHVEDSEVEVNEVYAIDVIVTTGEGDGKPKLQDEKQTTVYKRLLDREYNLKMKASRALFSEVNRKFPALPFTMRAIEDKRAAKLGLVECVNHELLQDFPVLWEKPGEIVAQFKSTVLLMPNGSDQLSSFPIQELDTEGVKVEDEALLALMTQSIKKAKKKGGKKAKKKAKAQGVPTAD